jgi:hypothetical protein
MEEFVSLDAFALSEGLGRYTACRLEVIQ